MHHWNHELYLHSLKCRWHWKCIDDRNPIKIIMEEEWTVGFEQIVIIKLSCPFGGLDEGSPGARGGRLSWSRWGLEKALVDVFHLSPLRGPEGHCGAVSRRHCVMWVWKCSWNKRGRREKYWSSRKHWNSRIKRAGLWCWKCGLITAGWVNRIRLSDKKDPGFITDDVSEFL